MRINRALNLVVPVERDDVTIYFHSTPISREVYEANYRIISAAHAEVCAGSAAQMVNGVRTAALALKANGRRMAEEAGADGDFGASAMLGEIRRQTIAIVPNDSQWETLPVDVAIQRNLIDGEEWSEVENALVFFMLIYWMAGVREREATLRALAGPLGLLIESLSPTEWIGSMRQSMRQSDSTAQPSFIPS